MIIRSETSELKQRPILPHDVDAERVLLGAMILGIGTIEKRDRIIETAREIVWPDDLYIAVHQAAYAEIVRRHQAGEPITLASIIATIGHFRIDDDIPLDSIETICHRIRDAAILREAATTEGIRVWQLRGGA
jgi:replicative DNA helicase